MTQVLAAPIGPDGLGSGGAFENDIESDRTAWWYAMGAQQSVLSGLAYAGVGGLMALDLTAGAALISERDGSGNLQDRGYLLRAASTTRVTFGAASASARNDALVAAVVDTEDGPVGTGGLATGGHLVAVPGVSGTSTPRTDGQITTYLGRGGWLRLADVSIASTDTQINTGTIVLSSAYQRSLIRLKQSATLAIASTTPTLVPGMTASVNFVAGLVCRYSLSVDISRTDTDNNPCRVGLFIDGSQLADSMNIVFGEGSSNTVIRFNGSVTDWITGLSGAHTVTVRAFHDSGTSSSWTVNGGRLIIEQCL